MRNVFLFIRRYAVFFLFLIMQVIAISMLVRYNKSQQARYMQYSYEVTGRVNKQVDNLTRYLYLVDNNRRLAQENEAIRNRLSSNFVKLDSAASEVYDTAMVDSSRLIRKYLYRYARVVNSTTNQQNNYITLERGTRQGIQPGMAVAAPGGIVGLIVDASPNMSLVMSLIHRKQSTSVSIKGRAVNGIIEWDGASPSMLQLYGIPKSTELQKGDTVLTSNISLNYPPGLMVGVIESFVKQEDGNNYIIQVKSGANFYGLEHVQVIENTLLEEQKRLEKKADRSTN